ncbi:MAG: LysR family transcriptional regulator [Rickettsiaceae bacterium]|nr:LysR family transcriptional regulator [Rickettsiaceae bacterium]
MISSPNDIGYFIEVAQTLNLTRAAERLGIAQPSLTLAIQRLEKSLGVKILSRAKTGVALTKAGEQLLIYAKNLIQSWDDLKYKAIAAETEVQGTFTLGMHSSVALYSSGKFLPALIQKHPKLTIKLKHDLSRKICEQIISAQIDIGIVINPIKHPDLIITKLCTDVVTVWNNLKPNDYTQNITNGNAVLLCDPELAQSQNILKQIKASSIKFDRIISSNNLELIAELIIKGAGIGILPSRVANFISKTKLEKINKAPTYVDEVCLVQRFETKNIKSLQVIKEQVKKSFNI